MHGIRIGLTLLLSLATTSLASVFHHDDSFQPDHILRVTAEDYNGACHNRYSTLVNGSSPGPELRLKEGQVNWIRVYNDMKDDNTTIVSNKNKRVSNISLTVAIALAWPDCIYSPVL